MANFLLHSCVNIICEQQLIDEWQHESYILTLFLFHGLWNRKIILHLLLWLPYHIRFGSKCQEPQQDTNGCSHCRPRYKQMGDHLFVAAITVLCQANSPTLTFFPKPPSPPSLVELTPLDIPSHLLVGFVLCMLSTLNHSNPYHCSTNSNKHLLRKKHSFRLWYFCEIFSL